MSDPAAEEETTQQEEQTEEQQEEKKDEGGNKDDGGNKDEELTYQERETKRHRQYEKQLEKLKETLSEEKSKIVKPESIPHTPYIWNSLAPYYKTDTVQYLMESPNEVRHGWITRKTAVNLVDPEVSHRMDVELDPVPDSQVVLSPREKKKEKKEPVKKEGSTRLPKWPVVKMEGYDDMANKDMDWSDVPKLREELKQKYSGNATERVKKDYQRTRQDWTRMELDELKKSTQSTENT